MPGAQCARSLACETKKHTSIVTTVTPEITRHSPRNGFTAYTVLSPATNSCCHRRQRIKGSSNPVELDFASANLTPATGARTTRFCRPLKRRSSCTPHTAHEVHLALRLPLRALRPCVHRSPPRARDDARSPLWWDGMARDMHLIWVGRKQEYF